MHRFFTSFAIGALCSSAALAQAPESGDPSGSNPGYFKDPATGIVYRQVTRTVDTPVTETQMQSQTQTVYKPQTVTESKPMTRTVFTPVIENRWEPRLHGRWNPFSEPTVAYHHVPTTHWTSRQETIQQVETKTNWVAENRTIEVPTQVVRMTRQQQVDYEPVGQVAAPPTTVQSAIASRLRPLAPTDRISPSGTQYSPTGIATAPATMYAAPSYNAPQIATSNFGRMTSDPPRRNSDQGGLRVQELMPNGGVRGSMLR